jgi:leucyl-tRNA synthetase
MDKAKVEKINFKAIAAKWQRKWEEKKAFKAVENPKKKKYYVLEMYPYPSASYLHMGHVRNYTIGDVYARFKRMQGFNVLYPMGYDSFGLPAETAAKKENIHPKKYADDSMKKIMQYQKALGNSYDWDRVLYSHDPDYFKWNQYFFIKLFEKGLAYVKNAPVNWCEHCQSVLANEEAEGGVCWRCEHEVGKKELKQWFYRITSYADRLLKDLEKIDWPEKIKVMQENWIGKSFGTEITFMIGDEPWNIFTTRPDTIFGVTFMVISAMHPRLLEITDAKHKKEVEAFIKKCNKVRTPEETEALEKEGVFIGRHAINPINGEKVPVYAGNFVLADYGCGMVMAVPAHDQKDFEFAKKYDIPVKVVINPPMYDLNVDKMGRAYTGEGRLVDSGEFTGSESRDAIDEITAHLKKIGKGKKTVQYKIRDWLISRQRYWGTPIPIIYCNNCAKEDVLILHGWDENSKSSYIPELVKDLKLKGYKPHAFDQPGTKAPKFEEWFRFAEQKIKEIGKDNLSIVGHSM